MKYQDYYQILGLSKDATTAEIKKAYRKQARLYHPDVNSEAGAEDKFKQVNEAYEVLKDSKKRQAYDQFGNDWKHGHEFTAQNNTSGFGNSDFSDFFESVFGNGAQRGRQDWQKPPPQKGEDQLLKLDISLEEAYTGGSKTIQFSQKTANTTQFTSNQLKKLKVNIPKGVANGQKIRLSKQGYESNDGGEAGDLYLQINILEHQNFKLDGNNINLRLPLTPWEAAQGATINVPTLEGKVGLKIKPGMLSGQKIRLKGKGMPGGDQFVEVMIQTPPANDSNAQQFYQDMKKRFDFNPRSF